jgi:hypothetical protein
VATIRRLGVNVVGDLDSLGTAPPPAIRGAGEEPAVTIPMRAVTQAVIGVIIGSRTEAPIDVYQAARANPSLLRRVRRRLSRWAERAPASEDSELD